MVGLNRKQNQDPGGTWTIEKVGKPSKKDNRGSERETMKENSPISAHTRGCLPVHSLPRYKMIDNSVTPALSRLTINGFLDHRRA